MSSIPDSVYFVISTQVSSRYVLPSSCPAAAGHVPSSVEYTLRGRKKKEEGNNKKAGRTSHFRKARALHNIEHDNEALTFVSHEVQLGLLISSCLLMRSKTICLPPRRMFLLCKFQLLSEEASGIWCRCTVSCR